MQAISLFQQELRCKVVFVLYFSVFAPVWCFWLDHLSSSVVSARHVLIFLLSQFIWFRVLLDVTVLGIYLFYEGGRPGMFVCSSSLSQFIFFRVASGVRLRLFVFCSTCCEVGLYCSVQVRFVSRSVRCYFFLLFLQFNYFRVLSWYISSPRNQKINNYLYFWYKMINILHFISFSSLYYTSTRLPPPPLVGSCLDFYRAPL